MRLFRHDLAVKSAAVACSKIELSPKCQKQRGRPMQQWLVCSSAALSIACTEIEPSIFFQQRLQCCLVYLKIDLFCIRKVLWSDLAFCS